MKTKPRVTGIGGIFFKAKDPKKLQAWYRQHLGLPLDPTWGGCQFEWRGAKRPKEKGCTVWSVFDAGTPDFRPSRKPFMINYRVANLQHVLAELKKEGVWIDQKTEESEFGKFGWIMDGEGNRIERWERPRARRQPAK